MLDRFIQRPLLSTVVSIIIFLLGLLGLYSLPLTEYPEIAPPTVQVNARYLGANAETVIESVIIPLEEEINGVDGMEYIKSTASNDGSATISIFFEQGYNPDLAAVNVQNRVAKAYPVIPQEVIRSGITVQKRENTALIWIAMIAPEDKYDVTFIHNYLNINIKPELQRIKGIGAIDVLSDKDYAMRIWLHPDKMRTFNLNVEDVFQAIDEQSRESAAGSIGKNSGQPFEYVIKYKGRFKTANEYGDIVIRAFEDGHVLRLKDIAKVELDAYSYSSVTRTQGKNGFSMGLFQTPGSNAQEVIERVHLKMQELKKDFPEGLDYVVTYDTNEFLSASIAQVRNTFIEAFILVFLVVFIFLQDFKSTLIPAISVPVSIVGTFFFLHLFGYSLKLLTLFSLILAIGIVVDDAIVVVEAVHKKLEDTALSAKEASQRVMSEISGAIISITLVMAAVFVPVMFIKGPTGVFYEQFGVTLIIAVLISAITALTISPALCAIFLKTTKKNTSFITRFYNAFNAGFQKIVDRYTMAIVFMIRFKWVAFLLMIIAGVSIWWVSQTTPTGFVPTEDRSVIFANIELAPGTSLDRTYSTTQKIYELIEDVPGIRSGALINGQNFFSGIGSSYSMIFIMLDNWKERQNEKQSVNNLISALEKQMSKVPEAQVIFFTPPSVPGFGSADGFEVQLLDKNSGNLREFDDIARDFVTKLNAKQQIAYSSNSFTMGFPQFQLQIDVDKAKVAGYSINSILTSIQTYIGGYYINDFSRFGKQFRVLVQALPSDRNQKESIEKLFVRNNLGEMAPLSSFVTLEKVYGPQTLNRFNLYNAITINGSAADGYSSGEAIKTVMEVASDLPAGYDIAFSGISLEEIASEGQSTIILIMSVLFVYLFLTAQFESYIMPFAVLLSLVFGVAGAFITTKLAGLEINIYFNIALVMLIGLLAKNAILIIEYAKHFREKGMNLALAAISAASLRLRPILMTSFAFIVGLLPLVFAGGIGEKGNNSIGTGAAGGMFIGTIIGLFVIPVLFVVCQFLHEKINPVRS